jgi:uncharacterized membrane protein YeaQ/YmgE (transglycosylase-associated protein family)
VGIVAWVVWGLFVGLIARALLPGRQKIGLLWTIALGIGGSLLGGFLATEVIDIADADEFDLGSFIIAVGTSVVLLGIGERVAGGRLERGRKDRELERGDR